MPPKTPGMKRYHIFAVLWVALPLTALGQTEPSHSAPCSQAEARQFDFWIGEWEIQAKERPPGSDQWTENKSWIRTRVRRALSGCVLIEESIDKVAYDTLVVGMSLTSYNIHLGKYQQLWVDQQGSTWEYVGGWEDESMVLYLEPTTSSGESIVPFEATTRIRMVFSEIARNGLVWGYEYSTDGGHEWTRTNEAVYSRRGD